MISLGHISTTADLYNEDKLVKRPQGDESATLSLQYVKDIKLTGVIMWLAYDPRL